ncbi:ribonucleoside-diphosphate reductase subunit alpha [Candidatus Babela massiliensis]|uniref:Ribonucleoside-diphosphate reductase n=1 Tax=Candidatus Babela massiliensis TaxID=673862 RepID=V6DGB6_9BACT|nr:ribonucleoside-diphosphate reductase subunit alpha [Candidatus Babela massiliensis]CDK30594.1 Ribonucleotide reductase alpha subunit [Candidatus Babela massiliensis]
MESKNMSIRDALAKDMREPLIYSVVKRNGQHVPLDYKKLNATFERVIKGYEKEISVDNLIKEVLKNIYDGISTQELEKALILSTIVFIEQDPAYDIVASRLLHQRLFKETRSFSVADDDKLRHYRESFINSITTGVKNGLFDKRMLQYDLEYLSNHLSIDRDKLFGYMGLNTLYERYLFKINNRRLEMPQSFWMRIAMGLALEESDKNSKALEFYNLLSTLRYTPSTPTLFHSGFPIAQLSSCFLTTVKDDLGHIFKCLGDNAQLAKWAGGLGCDWTNIRGTGAYIKSIKATSQGVIPYLKIANDVVVAITRSGIRRGGTCVFLETWHIDIEDFLDLRRNTGDERRRTHDMNTANWIPDLFMKRVLEDKEWTLFSPEETPDLHSLYGAAFEKRYSFYEEKARLGEIRLYKVISAKQLWRKMLTRLFETGHPWITFKDPSNIRSPQDHVGVVNSSNLCTEITLNTAEDETAVCNLGSINLSQHVVNGEFDYTSLEATIRTAIRMLDNVIDLNFYPTPEAKQSNMRHRPVGLGVMGLQDALFKLDIPFASQQAKEFCDLLMEKISYFAIETSCLLAQERGAYASFKGSKWERGIFPLDTLDLLERERSSKIEVSRESRLDWRSLKDRVKLYGMRNSNLMAVAPTATISTITGCYPCIEPIYENIYVESNVTGEFTIVNKYLVNDLKSRNLWSKNILDKIKFYDGNLSLIEEIPSYLKEKYKTAFDIDPEWLIELAAVRSKWIDQSQSLNTFLKGVSGSKLSDIYFKSWKMGIKTNYYLRTLGASQIEKSTLDTTYGFTQKRNVDPIDSSTDTEFSKKSKVCNIGVNQDCESCQ